MIVQTAQFTGIDPDTLYDAYLSSATHSAMTAGARPATFRRPGRGDVAYGETGDELVAFGAKSDDGDTIYSLGARILRLVPKRLIVMSWRNMAWDQALDPDDRTDLASTVELTFAENFAGAEVRLVQSSVPSYRVRIPDTGEVGPLEQIVNTHWSILYWDPMRRYFSEADDARSQLKNHGGGHSA
jgi:uncharacterized protein YndB with AHSA1/START domain